MGEKIVQIKKFTSTEELSEDISKEEVESINDPHLGIQINEEDELSLVDDDLAVMKANLWLKNQSEKIEYKELIIHEGSIYLVYKTDKDQD